MGVDVVDVVVVEYLDLSVVFESVRIPEGVD